MIAQEINLPDLIERFGSEDKCRDYLTRLRWPHGVRCPRCDNPSVSKIEARIGRRVYVGLYSCIGYADIGPDVVVANYVSVLSGANQHNFSDPERPIFAGEDTFTQVKIGANTFLGDKVTVMADIGEATIIGAGAVVSSPIPPYSVAVGAPARVVKDRRPARD